MKLDSFSAVFMRPDPASSAEELITMACTTEDEIDELSDKKALKKLVSARNISVFQAEHLSLENYSTSDDVAMHPESRIVNGRQMFIYEVLSLEIKIGRSKWIGLAGSYSNLLKEVIRIAEPQLAKQHNLQYLKLNLTKVMEAAKPKLINGQLKILGVEFRMQGDLLAPRSTFSGSNVAMSPSFKAFKNGLSAMVGPQKPEALPSRLAFGYNLFDAPASRSQDRPFDLKLAVDEHGNFRFKSAVDAVSLKTLRNLLEQLDVFGGLDHTPTCPARRRNVTQK